MISNRRRVLKDDSASMAVEAALLFPIVLGLLLMTADTISYFATLRKLSAAAATAGDLLASAGETVDQTDLAGMLSAAAPSGVDAAAAEDVGMIVQVYQVIDGYQVPRWEYWENTYCGVPNGTDVSQLTSDGADILVADACVNWSPLTFSVLGMSPRPVAQYSIIRPKRSLTTFCIDCY